MKYFYPLLVLLLGISRFTAAQITVGANTFPAPGDSLITCIDNLPSSIDLIGPGGPHIWDFSNLQAPFAQRTLVLSPRELDLPAGLSKATFIANVPLLEGKGFYRTQADRLELLGFSGPAPEGIAGELTFPFNPPSVERWAPLNYQDNRDQSFSFTLTFPVEALQDLDLDSLPVQPDSLRVTFQIERTYEVDAFGTLILPEGNYEVLREKRTETRSPELEIFIPVLNWVSLSEDLVPPDFFGPAQTITFHFFNDEVKEPVAIVATDNQGTLPISVEYKSKGLVTDIRDQAGLKPGVFAYPNPAITQIRFDFKDLKPGTYTLTIYNVLGQPLWKRPYQIRHDQTEKVNLSRFNKGTYLYSLEDSKGKIITAKRFVIIRP
jgi:hypothetical protein